MVLYLVGGATVLGATAVMAMAGLGAAFLFVPLFYYLGVPFVEASATALLLNAVSLSFATVAYARAGLINVRIGIPVLIVATILAPLGAAVAPGVDRHVLLWLFVGFLVFAGAMMLLYRPAPSANERANRRGALPAVAGLGGVAGFLGGLLGVGGGNVVLPGLTFLGLAPKVAAGTTALVVTFSSLSGFLGHATFGHLDPAFVGTMAVLAAAGSLIGSRLMTHHVSGAQLKLIIGVVLWLIASKMALDAAGLTGGIPR